MRRKVRDLARALDASFNHVNRSANSLVDLLAKEGVGCCRLDRDQDGSYLL